MRRLIVTSKVLGMCCLTLAALACSSYAQSESFLFYINGGPAFPVDDSDLKAGWSAGGGIGIVVSSESEFSLELGMRADWYHFSRDTYLTGYIPPYPGTSILWGDRDGNHVSVDLELRYRRNLRRFFNPYGVFGIALYELNSTIVLGFGSDLGTGPEKKRLVFWEVRYIPEPYAILRLLVGIRLG